MDRFEVIPPASSGLTGWPVKREEPESWALGFPIEPVVRYGEHKPDVDPQLDIALYLADGTLERHLGFVD